MDDLFGHVPQKGELFQESMPVTAPIVHTPETVRALCHATIAEAREAQTMPWTPRQLRKNTAGFPFWAEWLKNGEGDQLLLEFKAEIDRLQPPVDQLAPNWREMWGLDDAARPRAGGSAVDA